MLAFFVILKEIILPVFVIMMLGFFMQKRFTLDVQTLARLNIYYLVPGFIFVRLYETDIVLSLLFKVLGFVGLLVFILYVLARIVAKLLKLNKNESLIFSNSVVFFNSGNYGVPVNDLVFRGDPFAMSIQVVVLMFQNIFIFTYGIFSMSAATTGHLRALLAYFRMPVIYALLAGLLMNIYEVPVPEFIWTSSNYIADAMIGLALFTLGAQVARLKITRGLKTVYFSIFIRLIASPTITLVLIFLFKIEGITAQALLIASAMPTSVNSSVIAEEYKTSTDLAAQIVLFSTVVSAFSVTLVIYIAKILF